MKRPIDNLQVGDFVLFTWGANERALNQSIGEVVGLPIHDGATYHVKDDGMSKGVPWCLHLLGGDSHILPDKPRCFKIIRKVYPK